MALTDAERLQMVGIALMRHNVYTNIIQDVPLISQPAYTTKFPVPPFDKPYEMLNPADFVGISYSHTIS